ncbi:MAG: DUF5830 family protein [Halobacteriales archaeon]
MDDETLERGLAVVRALAPAEPSVADLVDALEAALERPDAIREVLKRAEAEGLIERDERRVRHSGRPATRRRRGGIVAKAGEFSCRRCGRALSTGYFLRVERAEVGPYGSTCIRKVTGRAP